MYHIGASQLSAILGFSKWQSPREVQNRIFNPTQDTAGEAAHFGTVFEPAIAEEYARRARTHVKKVDEPKIKDGWLRCTPDYEVRDAGAVRKSGVGKAPVIGLLEVKTASEFLKGDWEAGVPPYYMPQVYAYLHEFDYPAIAVAAVVGGNKYFEHVLVKNDQTQALWLEWKGFVRRWYDEFVAPGPEKAPFASAATAKEVLKGVGHTAKHLVGDSDALAHMHNLLRLKKQVKELDCEIDRRESILAEWLVRHGGDVLCGHDGNPMLSIRRRAGSESVDRKKLKAEYPEAYEACKKLGPESKYLAYSKEDGWV